MFLAVSILLVSPGQPPRAAPATPVEILEAAIEARAKIRDCDIEAEIESIYIKRATNEKSNRAKRFRTVVSGQKFRSDSEHRDLATNALIKQATLCKGCMADGLWYFRDRLGDTTNAAADSMPAHFQEFAFDLRTAGYESGSIENVLRDRRFALLRSPKYDAPTRGPDGPDGTIVLQRKQTTGQGTLQIHVNPKLKYAITRLEFSMTGDPQTRSLTMLTYAAARNGIYFPTGYVHDDQTKDSTLKEVAKFTVHSLNEPLEADATGPSALDVRFNSVVMVREMKKDKPIGVGRFYDGEKLVRYPPDVAEYTRPVATAPPPASTWRVALYWAGLAAMVVAAMLLLRHGFRRRTAS